MREQIGGITLIVWIVVTILFSFTSETALVVWTFNIIVVSIFILISYEKDDDNYDDEDYYYYPEPEIDHEANAQEYVDNEIANLTAKRDKQAKKTAKAEAKLLAYKKANNLI